MAGGISWGELYDVLDPLDYVYRLIFLFFISFAIFACMNVVTGVFVETAMNSSKKDREHVIQEVLNAAEQYRMNLAALFVELDTDGSGTISWQEFEDAMSDKRVVSYFKALELDISDARAIFPILDKDHQGVVSINEFFTGCERLKGGAKSLDIAKLLLMSEWMVHNMHKTDLPPQTSDLNLPGQSH